jgi:hypothetical protein
LTEDLVFPFFGLIVMKLFRTKIFWYLVLLSVLLAAVVLVHSHLEKREVQRTEERFVSTFVELSVAQKMFSQLPESYDSARSEILSRNEFSQQDFSALEEAYREEPERWVKVWQEVVKRLQQLQEQGGKRPARVKEPPLKERTVPP